MKDPKTFLIQSELNDLGFGPLVEDGINGPKTRDAYNAWYISTRGTSADPDAPDGVFKTEFRKSPHQGGKIVPKYIVLHSSYGKVAGDISWITQDRDHSKVSYHYLVRPDTGNRVQFVKTDRRAYHAGRSVWKGRKWLNGCSIGIACTGSSKRQWNAQEVLSVAMLCDDIMKENPSIGYDDILTHQDIAPDRKDDTSKENQQAVLAKLREIRGE
tara:strand:- start:157 stop:798 length:642 start_codon:yes stop_codon:yes gene_type:complete